MKKIMSILVAGLMLISMASVAFAAEGDNAPDEPGLNCESAITCREGTINVRIGKDDQGCPIWECIESAMNQTQTRLRDGTHSMEGGEQLQIRAHVGEMMQLQSGDSKAKTGMEMMQKMVGNKTQLHTKLSNGRDAEIKIMPNVASENAIKALKLHNCVEENGCTIELKEVGEGNQTKAAYEVKTQKEARMFGLFKTRMNVQAQINAETGEVINTKRPWWSFMASEDTNAET